QLAEGDVDAAILEVDVVVAGLQLRRERERAPVVRNRIGVASESLLDGGEVDEPARMRGIARDETGEDVERSAVAAETQVVVCEEREPVDVVGVLHEVRAEQPGRLLAVAAAAPGAWADH